ncbi:MAG: hypothetical protein ACPGYV_09715, partial [Phycisphaeraceae bacterium]
ALPSGETTGSLRQMRRAVGDFLRRHNGAAQVQLLFSEKDTSPVQREAMFQTVINSHAELIRAILDRPQQHAQR